MQMLQTVKLRDHRFLMLQNTCPVLSPIMKSDTPVMSLLTDLGVSLAGHCDISADDNFGVYFAFISDVGWSTSCRTSFSGWKMNLI